MAQQILLVLSLLVAVSSALKCTTCAIFPAEEDMSEIQITTLAKVLGLLTTPECTDTTKELTATCATGQDECHKISVTSKLGGETALKGALLQCGTASGVTTLCGTYKYLALNGASVTIDECAIDSCKKDLCFSGAGIHRYSLYTLIVSFAAYLLVSR